MSDKRINAFRGGKCHWSQIVSTESVLRLKSSFSFPFLWCQNLHKTVGAQEVRRHTPTKPSVRKAGWDNPDRDAEQLHVGHLQQKVIQNHLRARADVHATAPERSRARLLAQMPPCRRYLFLSLTEVFNVASSFKPWSCYQQRQQLRLGVMGHLHDARGNRERRPLFKMEAAGIETKNRVLLEEYFILWTKYGRKTKVEYDKPSWK